MFAESGHRCLWNFPPAPRAEAVSDTHTGTCRKTDEWNRFYLSSALMHPAPGEGGDTQHLAGFVSGGLASGAALRMNLEGMRLEDLAGAMRVAKEAEGFLEDIRARAAPVAEFGSEALKGDFAGNSLAGAAKPGVFESFIANGKLIGQETLRLAT